MSSMTQLPVYVSGRKGSFQGRRSRGGCAAASGNHGDDVLDPISGILGYGSGINVIPIPVQRRHTSVHSTQYSSAGMAGALKYLTVPLRRAVRTSCSRVARFYSASSQVCRYVHTVRVCVSACLVQRLHNSSIVVLVSVFSEL